MCTKLHIRNASKTSLHTAGLIPENTLDSLQQCTVFLFSKYVVHNIQVCVCYNGSVSLFFHKQSQSLTKTWANVQRALNKLLNTLNLHVDTTSWLIRTAIIMAVVTVQRIILHDVVNMWLKKRSS